MRDGLLVSCLFLDRKLKRMVIMILIRLGIIGLLLVGVWMVVLIMMVFLNIRVNLRLRVSLWKLVDLLNVLLLILIICRWVGIRILVVLVGRFWFVGIGCRKCLMEFNVRCRIRVIRLIFVGVSLLMVIIVVRILLLMICIVILLNLVCLVCGIMIFLEDLMLLLTIRMLRGGLLRSLLLLSLRFVILKLRVVLLLYRLLMI